MTYLSTRQFLYVVVDCLNQILMKIDNISDIKLNEKVGVTDPIESGLDLTAKAISQTPVGEPFLIWGSSSSLHFLCRKQRMIAYLEHIGSKNPPPNYK